MSKILKFLILCLITATFIFSACKPEQKDSSTKDDLTVILHAGGGSNGLNYLNAQETFDIYYNLGYRYFEYDLKLSTDGRLIASHAGEHLEHSTPENLTYEQFKQLKLSNGYTPANEEWLIQTIINHPDVRIIVDAKMPNDSGDIAVIQRLEQLESVYNCDLSSNVIPEIFTKEMWEALSISTTFDRYIFSHYKVYYSIDMMLEYFNDQRIWAIALPVWSDEYITSNVYRLKESGKNILFFTPTTTEEVNRSITLGANGLYVDSYQIIPEKYLENKGL